MKYRKEYVKLDTESIVALIVAVFASTGFWTFLTSRFSNHDKKRKDFENELEELKKSVDLQSKMLKGLGHDRIVYLGNEYLSRKSITKDEYENLHDYLFDPYKNLGGNGTAEKVMREVEKLPLKDT